MLYFKYTFPVLLRHFGNSHSLDVIHVKILQPLFVIHHVTYHSPRLAKLLVRTDYGFLWTRNKPPSSFDEKNKVSRPIYEVWRYLLVHLLAFKLIAHYQSVKHIADLKRFDCTNVTSESYLR